MTDPVPHDLTARALAAIDGALRQLQGGDGNGASLSATSTADLIGSVRGQRDALQSLPPRYLQVLDLLLDRFESSALFTEESCSFSRGDLVQGLAQWLVKAREAAAATDPRS